MQLLSPILTRIGIATEIVGSIDPEDPRPVLSTLPRPGTISGRHFQLRPFEHIHVEENSPFLFEPFLPFQVLAACCELFHRKQTVGLWIPNAVLRTLVAGILRRAGHAPLILEESPDTASELPQTILMDVRPDQPKELQLLEDMLRILPQRTWIALIPGDEATPSLPSGLSAWVRKPVEPAALIRAIDGWDRPALLT
jgi:hypothetical protein